MTKWEDTKKYIKSMSSDGKILIDKAMKEAPGRVKYMEKEGKQFWEVPFKKNGHECFIQYQTSGGPTIYRILAFNNDTSTAYVREPLKERDNIDRALGL